VVAVHPYPPLRGRVDEWSAALESLSATGAGVPWVLPIAIDHVLADRRLGIAAYGVLDLPGSDHHAIYARLVLP
jgi:endonuclease/exonuclease/phosphatase family metal-dependent hydrolase